jgi:hypothetical protein
MFIIAELRLTGKRQSFPMQGEPEGGVRFQHKMSLNGVRHAENE